MAHSWRNWCGLCGRIPMEAKPKENLFLNLRKNEKLLEIAKRCFEISLERNTGFPVCPDCVSFLDSLSRFTEICNNTKELLILLRKKKIDDEEEIASLRSSYLSNENGLMLVEETVLKEEPVEEEILPEDEQMEVILEEGETEHYIIEQDLEPEDHEEIVEDEEEEESNTSLVDSKPVRRHSNRGTKSVQNPLVTDRRRTPQKRPPRPKTEADAFKCEECGKNFWTLQTLKFHENRHKPYNDPTKYRPFVCEVCGKPFVSEIALNEHRSVHTDDRPFQCPICPRSYKTFQQHKVHLKTHDDEKHVCPECGQLFSTRKTYNRHKIVHSDVKKHVCVLCGDKFKRAVALKDHLMSHFGLKPYKCPFCDQSFQYGVILRKHRKKYHPEELAALEASGKMEQVWIENRNLPKYSEMLRMAEEKAIKSGILVASTAKVTTDKES